jgi:hypothetical protein
MLPITMGCKCCILVLPGHRLRLIIGVSLKSFPTDDCKISRYLTSASFLVVFASVEASFQIMIEPRVTTLDPLFKRKLVTWIGRLQCRHRHLHLQQVLKHKVCQMSKIWPLQGVRERCGGLRSYCMVWKLSLRWLKSEIMFAVHRKLSI